MSVVRVVVRKVVEIATTILMIAGIVGFVIGSSWLVDFGKARQEERRLQLERDIADGLVLRTGEQVITDEQTGCKYIKTNEGLGYTLTPRLDKDGRPMGCGTR